MAEVFRGLYRTIAWTYVTNGTMAFQVPEADYRAFGYEPHYDNLPWKENMTQLKVTKNASSIEYGRQGQDQVQDGHD
jgi:hypothetical protein